MSEEVPLRELADTVRQYGFAYLTTVGEDARAHIVAVSPTIEGGEILVAEPGRKTRRNLDAHPVVTFVWPPTQPGGYSLIVDGAGALRDDGIAVTPSRAVLHRPAPSPRDDAGCESDCVELPLAGR